MTRDVAKQKAAIARDAEHIARQRDRQRLSDMRAGIVELRRYVSRQKILDRKERRAALARIRAALLDIPRAERDHRHRMASDVLDARQAFRVWWAMVLAERATRLTDIRQLREHLKRYRAGSKARIAASVAATKRAADELLEELAQGSATRRIRITQLLEHQERELKIERTDQRQFRSTKRHVQKHSKTRVTKTERRQEFSGGVEANLVTAEEHAIWQVARRQILSDAKARGITAPDAIAELVRERAEADPDLATDAMQASADRWLAAELKRMQ